MIHWIQTFIFLVCSFFIGYWIGKLNEMEKQKKGNNSNETSTRSK